MAARLDYIQLLVVIHRYRYSKWKTSHIHSYQQLVQLIFEKKKSYFSKRQLKLRTIVAFYLDLLLRCYHAYAQQLSKPFG